MAQQRMNVDWNSSFRTVFGRQFSIDPEYLLDNEIRYELLIRGVETNGERRELTALLRRCVSEERRSPGARQYYEVGPPSEEFEYCNRNIARLKSLLQQVSRDPISHDRFMTIFLHFEGRLNRIRSSQVLDLSQVVFSVNEELSTLFKKFCDRIRPNNQQNIPAVVVQPSTPIIKVSDSVEANDSNPNEIRDLSNRRERSNELNGRDEQSADERVNEMNGQRLNGINNINEQSFGYFHVYRDGSSGPVRSSMDAVQMVDHVLHRLDRVSIGSHATQMTTQG